MPWHRTPCRVPHHVCIAPRHARIGPLGHAPLVTPLGSHDASPPRGARRSQGAARRRAARCTRGCVAAPARAHGYPHGAGRAAALPALSAVPRR
eukprot:5468749-Prymnesium_polylepis.1